MSVTLKDVGSGFKRTAINQNFTDIESEINNNLLNKDGSTALEADLDFNSQRAINLADGVFGTDGVNVNQLNAIVSGAGGLSSIAQARETQLGSQAVANVFTLAGITYAVGTNTLSVYRNGQRLEKTIDYTETTASSVTLTFTPNSTDRFVFITNDLSTSEVTTTAAITHTEDGTDYNLATYLSNREANTVAELKTFSLEVGEKVDTKGYYSSGDGGHATYIVAAPQAVDGYGDHTLANGNVAKLQIGNSVNVKQFGADPSGVLNSTLHIQAALDHGVKNIYFGDSADTYKVDPLFVKNDFTTLYGGGCELIDSGQNTLWAVINVLNADADGYDRPANWQEVYGVKIQDFVIDYDNAVDKANANYNMVQCNLTQGIEIRNLKLRNNFINSSDITRGSGIVFRGECRNSVVEGCEIDNMKFHGVGHVARYVTGNYSGSSGTATYTSKSQIDSQTHPKDGHYRNNKILNCSNTGSYAFDVHTRDGVSELENNYVFNCTSFFKNQQGSTYAHGNYIEQTGDDTQNLFWAGWSSDFLSDPRYPNEQVKVVNNIFRNINGSCLLSRAALVCGNTFYNDSGTPLGVELFDVNTSQANEIRIENNQIIANVNTFKLIDVASTAPDTTDIRICGNSFDLTTVYDVAGGARLMNIHSTSECIVEGNTYTENQNRTFSMTFCLIQNSSGVLIRGNSLRKTGTHSLVLANNAGGSTSNVVMGNYAITGTISGTFDLNADNLLV